MKRKLFSDFKKPAAFTLAFMILAFVFLALGLGTLGSAQSTGKAYELKQGTTVVFQLTPTPPKEEGGVTTQSTLKQIYLNVGTPYTKAGGVTRIRMRKTSSSTSSNAYYSTTGLGEKMLATVYFDSAANDALDAKNKIEEKNVIKNANFNWIAPFTDIPDTWGITTYKYELAVTEGNLLINEIVFVANDDTVIPVTVNREFSTGIDVKAAEACIDSQSVPSLAQSSFFRYGEEEVNELMTISEMKQGSVYSDKDVYHAERTYNALGVDMVALGVAIFGVSPFGLRVIPFLASFGILLFGYFTVKLYTQSDKAAFIFACLYALCGLSLGLGRLGTPLTVGLYFFAAALYFTSRFFMRGMKKATAASALPLVFGGLFGAAAICVHSALLVPAIGLVGLFAAGMVRQQIAKRYHLDKAIAEAEEAESLIAHAENKEEATAVSEEKKLAAYGVARDYNHRNALAPVAFFSMLVIGAFLLSLLAVVPVYYTYGKLYDTPAAPSLGLVNILWKSFAGGFGGINELAGISS
ncbi:MAG: glycosyltransferase family 39 protein, partial [Clostridiales bacterium]|nr:glycosyltransferase family 39 protein [Clostridiales bacterium]